MHRLEGAQYECSRPFGYLDLVTERNARLVVAGWVLTRYGPADELTFAFGGQTFAVQRIRRPALRAAMPRIPDAEDGGFQVAVPLPAGYLGQPLAARLVVRHRAGCSEVPVRYRRPGSLPLPPDLLLARATGNPRAEFFLASGMQTAGDLIAIVAAAAPDLQGGTLLEWGCGAGRITRHLLDALPGFAIHGTDVDAEAIDWLRDNMPRGEFALCGRLPPLAVPDGRYDAVLATCVLPELTLAEQQAWIDEFHRVVRPGGIVVVSTLGAHAATIMPLPRILDDLLRDGVLDGRNDAELQREQAQSLCFATFQLPDAVRRSWGRRFEELAFVEAGITCFHDVWVFRRGAAATPPEHQVEMGAVVAVRPLQVPVSAIAAHELEQPRAGQALPGSALAFAGWILGADAPVAQIEVLHRQRVLQRVPVDVVRADVAGAHPGRPWAAHCGFRCGLGLVGLPAAATLRVRAVFGDGRTEPIAELELRHHRVQWDAGERLTSVLLQSMGRMGTTWAMSLLDGHPQIVVDPEYPHEARPAQYLTHLLTVLARPADLQESVDQHHFFVDPHHVGRNPFFQPDRPGHDWFATRFVHGLADFCGRSIGDVYRHLAARLGKDDVRCFVEKVSAADHPFIHDYREVCGRLREVFLVRDLRDVLCSAKAFNDRRGTSSFGAEQTTTLAEFAAVLGAQGRALCKAWRERRQTSLLLRYEDLIRDPRTALQRVLEYLDLERTERTVAAMLAHAQGRSARWQAHATSPSAAASVGRWRTELPASLRASCTQDYGSYLAEFGYGADPAVGA